ncbi:MAG: hypothetical protein JEY94_12795 [Melioribacteraceae bacterium]|nr:hypothetical protein [Melioribacteraceae bacterium]
MIDKKSFYSEDEFITNSERNRIWKGVKKSFPQKERKKIFLDLKSFVFGMGFTVVVYFMIVGLYTTIENSIYQRTPNLLKVNKVYSDVINNLENSIIDEDNLKYPKVVVDGQFGENFERIKGINLAISDLKNIQISSTVKEQRLMNLYKMKLKAIEDLILIEVKNENFN